MELTEQQAREEFALLSDEKILELAIAEGKPTDGMSRHDLIELLLGYCVGCGKGRMTVIIISGNKQQITKTKTGVPCKTGNCK